MNCEQVQTRLGERLDGELEAETRAALDAHLAACPACRRRYAELEALVAPLRNPPAARPPLSVWAGIARRLDERSAGSIPPASPRPWVIRLARRTWAVAAAIVLGIGLCWVTTMPALEQPAVATSFSLRPVLEQADGDLNRAVEALMRIYGGRRVTFEEAARVLRVRVHTGQELPLGLRLKGLRLLNMGGHHMALAFHYAGPRGELLMLQCPPHVPEDPGNYECLACRVGGHDGRLVRCGSVNLMHIPTADMCLCIVTTLDEKTELPVVLDAVRVDF